jgi:hypothetical protein
MATEMGCSIQIHCQKVGCSSAWGMLQAKRVFAGQVAFAQLKTQEKLI